MAWRLHPFAELTIAELYAIVSLRERVFVVEQACAYLDADGHDVTARHLWCGDVTAYARILPAGAKYPSMSIGRVVVAPEARGRGLARELMLRAIAACTGPIELGAQAHLEAFYASLGFARTGDVYLEDGIPHVDMLRPA